MKHIARITLLLLWLFAITAPSIITLCDTENPIVVTNLNEEEQQETGKKSMGEEKYVKENAIDFSLIALTQNTNSRKHYLLGCFDFALEVISPPPEYLG
ncbi:hypothetical protein Q2T41_08555 [Maribacter confluentis]|uniref:Uncharacterized protein n=1 Tax=Maribacter confluentis TaxID=1656093 RepID=A0ABT8RP59_9FLAO|nr:MULTISPECIES: hypothetical protein [Maribacter]MDO1512704.1 hypothetical protein [Maribacter confluentis]TVZ15937.1 hypothetical protein JM81_2189 [Maribacter sp. MAR_2009_72]